MEAEDKKILDEWWATEPFGFDHPDTYHGIEDVVNKILVKREAENKRLRHDLRNMRQCVLTVKELFEKALKDTPEQSKEGK